MPKRNSQSRIAILGALAMVFAVCLPPESRAGNAMLAANERYLYCTDNAQNNPTAALKDAEAWLEEEKNPGAYHCKALALFELERYKESAVLLEFLAEYLVQDPPYLWANVLRQASFSRSRQGDMNRALRHISRAIAFCEDKEMDDLTVELLIDRARLFIRSDAPLKALQDLDQALAMDPFHPEALLNRAALFRRLEIYDAAESDLVTLLDQDPDHIAAQDALASLADTQ